MLVLEDPPYGPSVEEAKVGKEDAVAYVGLIPLAIEPQSADVGDDLEQHQGNGDSWSHSSAVTGRAGHTHEVPVQGHGVAGMG